MKTIIEYSQWTSSTTDGDQKVEYEYKSKDKTYYGVHDVYVSHNDKRIKATAKFDTGAKSSSIDLDLAKRLGINDNVLQAYHELEKVKVSKDMPQSERKKIEDDTQKEYTEKYPDISHIKLVKSGSGFSIRAYITITIEFDGRVMTTQANIKDRDGLSCEMLVGLSDIL